MTTFAGGASAASRNFVNKIAAVFNLPRFHTQYPSVDVEFMLELAVTQVRRNAGLEDNEAEKLRTERSSLQQENSRLRFEKRLSEQAAETNFAEAERLRSENAKLRIQLRVSGETPRAWTF